MTIQQLRNTLVLKAQKHSENKEHQQSFIEGMAEILLSGPFYKDLNIEKVRHALTAACVDLKITLSFGELPLALPKTEHRARLHPMVSWQEEIERKAKHG